LRRELRAPPEALLAIFLNMADGVILIDRRRRLSEINPAAEALVGWRQRDLDLLTCSVFGCRDEQGQPLCATQCMALRAIESGEVQAPRRMIVSNAHSGSVSVEATIVPIRSNDGRHTMAAMILRDLASVEGFEETIRALNEEIAEKNLALRSLQLGLSSAWKLPLVTIQSAGLTLQSRFAANLGESGLRQVKRVLDAAQELEGLFARLQAQARSSVSATRRRPAGPSGPNAETPGG
jgi:PAS domain S-box-containing protein